MKKTSFTHPLTLSLIQFTGGDTDHMSLSQERSGYQSLSEVLAHPIDTDYFVDKNTPELNGCNLLTRKVVVNADHCPAEW